MGVIGLLALAANVTSVLMLMRYKDGDANVRSVWLCSRNDAIGNIVVTAAAGAVWFTASAWPGLVVAGLMAGVVPAFPRPDPGPGRGRGPRGRGARPTPAGGKKTRREPG